MGLVKSLHKGNCFNLCKSYTYLSFLYVHGVKLNKNNKERTTLQRNICYFIQVDQFATRCVTFLLTFRKTFYHIITLLVMQFYFLKKVM